MHIQISDNAVDAWRLVADYESAQPQLTGKHGACVVFFGRMRDFNEDESVTQMELEHYPGMTEKFLQQIAEQAAARWSIMDVLIVHRVGLIHPAETIVIVAVWSAHRAQAYAANQFLMEALKSRAPFWKKEQLEDGGSRWVEKNTPGNA